jgi:hypothetical protein
MFDCGMHMGYNDHRRFPNFSYISKVRNTDSHTSLHLQFTYRCYCHHLFDHWTEWTFPTINRCCDHQPFVCLALVIATKM